MKSLFSLLCFILCYFAQSQITTPTTLNTGGGNYAQGQVQFDWSIGEETSIATFQNGANIIVTSGVIQPIVFNTGISYPLSQLWGKDEISVFPVPTSTTLEVTFKIAVTGIVTLKLYDMVGKEIMSKNITNISANYSEKLDLSALAVGEYFLNVNTPVSNAAQTIKTGNYKIQKL